MDLFKLIYKHADMRLCSKKYIIDMRYAHKIYVDNQIKYLYMIGLDLDIISPEYPYEWVKITNGTKITYGNIYYAYHILRGPQRGPVLDESYKIYFKILTDLKPIMHIHTKPYKVTYPCDCVIIFNKI